MGVRSSRQRELLEELSEWSEDLREAGIGSRVVLAEVPPGWGVTTVLADFAVMVADLDGSVALFASTGEVPSADAVRADLTEGCHPARIPRRRS